MTRTTLLLLVLLSWLGGGLGAAPSPLGAIFETVGGDEGCNADPNGRCIVVAPTSDEGCNADRDGKPGCKPGQ